MKIETDEQAPQDEIRKTMQALFDAGVKHLVKQQKRCMEEIKRKAGNNLMACCYQNADGLRCVVGGMFPEGQNLKSLEGYGAGDVEVLWALKQAGYELHFIKDPDPFYPCNQYTAEEAQLLLDMQDIHDNALEEQWPEEFYSIAKKWGLEPEAVSGFSGQPKTKVRKDAQNTLF